MLGEAVECGSRQSFAAEHLGPVLEWQIGGDDLATTAERFGQRFQDVMIRRRIRHTDRQVLGTLPVMQRLSV